MSPDHDASAVAPQDCADVTVAPGATVLPREQQPQLNRVPLVYIAGPYRAATRYEVERNIRAAEDMGYRIALLGAYPVIPHSNTRGYFEDAGPAELWLGGTLELMRRCDAVVFLPTWTKSSGSRAEHAEAERLGLDVFGVAHVDGGDVAKWIAMRREEACDAR